MNDISVNAVATMTVEIPMDSWPSSSSFDSLIEQVTKEAKLKLQSILHGHGGKVLSEPAIKFVVVNRKVLNT
jgi:hypothetical protein